MATAQITAKFSTKFMSARFRQRAVALSNEIIKAEEQSALALKTQAIKQSSGGLKTEELRKLAIQVNRGFGLYGTRSPMPPTNPAIINQQTGFLSRHWQTIVTTKPDGTNITLFNTAVYAKDLFQGTHYMIARPILQKVYELESEARLKRLNDAKKRALK